MASMDVYNKGQKVELNYQIDRFADSNPARHNKSWQCFEFKITGNVLVMYKAVELLAGWPIIPHAQDQIIVGITGDVYLVINELRG